MESIVHILIWAVLVVMGLALLTMLVFGIRSAAHGKVSPISASLVVVPLVLLAILGFVIGDWGYAGIVTVLVMFGVGVLAVILSGVRSVLGG